jgi:hypothetical protein
MQTFPSCKRGRPAAVSRFPSGIACGSWPRTLRRTRRSRGRRWRPGKEQGGAARKSSERVVRARRCCRGKKGRLRIRAWGGESGHGWIRSAVVSRLPLLRLPPRGVAGSRTSAAESRSSSFRSRSSAFGLRASARMGGSSCSPPGHRATLLLLASQPGTASSAPRAYSAWCHSGPAAPSSSGTAYYAGFSCSPHMRQWPQGPPPSVRLGKEATGWW